MPLATKHPVADHIRERAMFDEDQLQSLLTAYRHMIKKERWKAVDAVEKAIYAHRRDELERFAERLEQHVSSEGREQCLI